MDAAIAAAEARLAALKGQISALEAGKPLSKATVLADLKALRVTVAQETAKAQAVGARRDALAAQVKAMETANSKLRYQNEHLKKAADESGGAAAKTSSAAAAANSKAGFQMSAESMKASDSVDACGAVQVEGPGGVQYPCTKKLYFDEQQRYTCDGTVLGVGTVEEKGVAKTVVILNQTVMHPQGGGQPTDFGELRAGGTVFKVDMVRAVGGNLDSLIYHFGAFDGAAFAEGDTVAVSIDEDHRKLCARVHSAGHLVDDAMKICGDPLAQALKPTKGYHFADGPYVEYEGKVPADQREPLAKLIEKTLQALVKEGSPVRVVDAPYDQLAELCGEAFCSGPLMGLIPKDRLTRIVIVKELGCPCGGTHVADIKEIGHIVVTKVKVKKNKTQICYKLP
jgi:Ser-tRNA(Ala) deacylase AlaX